LADCLEVVEEGGYVVVLNGFVSLFISWIGGIGGLGVFGVGVALTYDSVCLF
jgi:hypothetical protein